MDFYFISYITLLVLSLFEIFQSRIENKYFSRSLFLIVIGILAIFAGIRYQVGVDYNSYLSIFRHVYSIMRPPYINIETGFKVIIVFFKSLGFPALSLFFVFSSVLLYFIQNGIEKTSRYKFFSLFLFFLIFYITYVFNVLRQGIVMSIFIYLIPDIKKNNHLKIFVFSLIAFTIHNSGMFIIISYFLYFFSLDKKTYIIMTFASLIYYFNNQKFISLIITVLPNVLSSKLTTFLTKFSGEVDLTSVLLRLIILILLMYYYNNLVQLKGYKGLFNIYFFGFVFYILFSFQDELATRINMFFRILEIILLPAIVMVEKDKIKKIFVFVLITLIATAIFLSTIRNPLNFPFNFYWDFI